MDTKVDPRALEGYASRLRNAATDLEGMASPPELPEAEEAAGLLASILSHVTTSLSEITSGLGAAGDSVASGSDVFVDTEGTNVRSMNNLSPE